MTIKAQLINVPKEVAEKLLDQENVSIQKKESGYVVKADNLVDFGKVMDTIEKIEING